MLLEKSFQAQVLIPMATSLAFGLLASTALVLLVVPLLYRLYVAIAFTEEQLAGDSVPRATESQSGSSATAELLPGT
jgi:hypothetical protein